MPKKTLYLDEELFVKALSRAVDDGDARFVEGHLQRLDSLVAKLRECLGELSQLQGRARRVGEGASGGDGQYTVAGPPVSVG